MNKTFSRHSFLKSTLLLGLSSGIGLLAQSGVWGQQAGSGLSGANVVAGQAAINQSGNITTITAKTDRTIINWDKFSIKHKEIANFLQPNSSSAILNRVTSQGNPSAIFGTLNSNGNVFLVNPSGIVVGPSGVINTNGFTASTLDISNNDFLKGVLKFRGQSDASVINQGNIQTKAGGAALLGRNVLNTGSITSDGGSISLATGGTVTLADGSKFTHADMATLEIGVSPYAGVIQNSGTIRATGAVESGGEVYLVNPSGRIMHDGTITANKGTGGGTVRLSGQSTSIGQQGVINADADRNGNGGNVAVWGSESTSFEGHISAKGGVNGGDGGHVDVSGENLTLGGTVSVGSATGKGGTVVFDPTIFNVDAAAANSIESSLAGGGTVVVEADQQINVNADIDSSAQGNAATLRFQDESGSDVVITLNSDISLGVNQDLEFDGSAILGTSAILTGNDVTFNSTVDGFNPLAINSNGVTNFFGAVGSNTAVGSIVTDAGGQTIFHGGQVITNGTQTYNDSFSVTQPTTFQSNFVEIGIVFAQGGNTNNNDLTVIADRLEIGNSLNAGTGIVTLEPSTFGRTINLGTNVFGSLGLTDAEIDHITASTLRIGSSSSGDLTVTNAISPAGTNTLSLISGGAIVDSNNIGADFSVDNLALQAVQGIGNQNPDLIIDTDVDVVAAHNSSSGAILIVEASVGGDLTVGTVDGVVGVNNQASGPFAGNRSLAVETNNGNLTIDQNVTAAARDIFLVAQHVGVGDRVFENNATISADATNGEVEIHANNMSLEGGSILAGANGRVILRNELGGLGINLGGSDTIGILGLTNEELNTITTDGVVQVGHSSLTNNIRITDSIQPIGFSTLDLETAGAVTDANTGTDITIENLVLRTGGGFGIPFGPIEFEIDNIAFNNTGGAIDIQSSSSTNITSLDGLSSSSNTGTTTEIFHVFGNLSFDTDVFSSGDARFTAEQIHVQNGVELESLANLRVDAITVNLDGNLTGGTGINGFSGIVNVLGSGGGAEIQDAVDISGSGVTINVSSGNYLGGVVIDKPLSLIGNPSPDRPVILVEDNTTGFRVVASDVTIDDFVFLGDSTPLNAFGVVVDSSASPLSGILIGDSSDTGVQGNLFAVLTTGLNVTDGGTGNLTGTEIGLGNSFLDNNRGMVFDGSGIDIVGDTLQNTSFRIHSGSFVELINGAEFQPGTPTIIDATGVNFDDLDLSVPANVLAVEGKLQHCLDTSTDGLLNFGGLAVPEGNSIQLAVNAAGMLAGPQTVTVGSGTFGGSVEVWVNDLTLQGQGLNTVIDTDAVDPFANNGDREVGFQIQTVSAISGGGNVSGVTIDGFHFSTPNSAQGNHGITLNSGFSTASNTTIQNSRFSDLREGILVRNSPLVDTLGDFTVDNVEMFDISQKGIFISKPLFRAASVLVTDSDIESTQEAIHFSRLGAGGTFRIVNNRLFSGSDSAIRFDRGFFETDLAIVGNSQIRGGDHGIEFRAASGSPGQLDESTIVIAGNDSIDGSIDGIHFENHLQSSKLIIGPADVDIRGTEFFFGGNLEIEGNVDAISIDRVNAGSLVLIHGNQTIDGLEGVGILGKGNVENFSQFQVVGNKEILGGFDGILFLDEHFSGDPSQIVDSELTIAGNETIQGFLRVGAFTGDIIDSNVLIGPATVNIDGSPVVFGSNQRIQGDIAGLVSGMMDGGTLDIIDNGFIVADHPFGNAYLSAGTIGESSTVRIIGNALEGASGVNIPQLGLGAESSVSIVDNDITSLRRESVLINGIRSSNSIEVRGGRFSGGDFGVVIAGFSPDDGTVKVTLDDLDISDVDQVGIYLFNFNTNLNFETTFQNGVTIDSSGGGPDFVGLTIDGPNHQLVGDTLADTVFVGNNGNFIELVRGGLFDPGRPTFIDATEVDFDGLDPGVPSQFQMIEDRVVHFIDDQTLGLIFPGGGFNSGEMTYDRFTRYEDYFQSISDLLPRQSSIIRYQPNPIVISGSLDSGEDAPSETQVTSQPKVQLLRK